MAFIRSGAEGAYTYKAVEAQNGCVINDDTEYRESAPKNTRGSNYFRAIPKWSATIDQEIVDVSDTDTTEFRFEEMQDAQYAGTKLTFVFCWVTRNATTQVATPDSTKRMYVGEGLVKGPINANNTATDNANTQWAIQGCFELDIVDPT
ncbi:MAG TPA: hypothetical protein DEP77_13010 [Bacteroidales bacterium]|nr:hypothetical protein [Bacteroidales bacterium]